MSTEFSDTKLKILETASRLFAKRGVEGTSIRDIARESGVNVAAVNYHFINKESLYLEIYRQAHELLEVGLKDISSRNQTLEGAIGEMFDFFNHHKAHLWNTMRLMMDEQIEDIERVCPKGAYGPPGGEVVAEWVQREVGGQKVDHETMRWAVRSIFGGVMHWTIMVNTPMMRRLSDEDPSYHPSHIRNDVLRQVRAVMAHVVQSAKKP